MTKTELTDKLMAWSQARRVPVFPSRSAAADTVNEMLDLMSAALVEGDSVQLTGFGTLSVGEAKEREGINPRTKEKITIPASKRVKFSASKALKTAVNGGEDAGDDGEE